jgi:hypothetical protein
MKQNIILILTGLAMLLATAVSVLAAAPTIDSVVFDSSYTPTEAGTTYTSIKFNVSDTDGVANLNDSQCRCDVDDQATYAASYASNTSCTFANMTATQREYTCSIGMIYWYANGSWSVNVTAGDDTTLVSNSTGTFAYNQLVASSLDGTAVAFGTIASAQYGTTVTDSNAATTITNTGNKVLSLAATGATAAAGSNSVSAGNFSVDTDSNSAGAMALTTGSQAISGASVPIEDITPGGNTEDIWFFFAVPNPLLPGSYASTWTLTES